MCKHYTKLKTTKKKREEKTSMEKEFKKRLKKELSKRIKGDISVHIKGDMLIIDIIYAGVSIWRYTINNIYCQLSVGISSKIVADTIIKQYKTYILSNYFI